MTCSSVYAHLIDFLDDVKDRHRVNSYRLSFNEYDEKRDNIEELFGKWLSRISKTKVENKDFNKEERMKKFEEFKSEIQNKISGLYLFGSSILENRPHL